MITDLLGIKLGRENKNLILDKIKKFIEKPSGFFHIVSLNPENIVIAQHDPEYKQILTEAQIAINDGIGVILAARILKLSSLERLTGSELFQLIIDYDWNMPLRILFLGGEQNLANKIANCYQKKRAQFVFYGLMGYQNIKKPTSDEDRKVFSIISQLKPQIIFAAFGSPNQEKWFWRHRRQLSGVIGVGVGGVFDFLAGRVPRAPLLIQRMGLEWLFRLIIQPWRIWRQRRLAEFTALVIREWIKKNFSL